MSWSSVRAPGRPALPGLPELPSLSAADTLRFNRDVVLPLLAQGRYARRPAIAGAAARTGADGRAILRLARLRRDYGPGPVWARELGEPVLLVFSPMDVRRVLEDSAREFAADPIDKKRGMAVFQPNGLAISRGSERTSRRHFTDAVLGAGLGECGPRLLAVCREEISCLIDGLTAAALASAGGGSRWVAGAAPGRRFRRSARTIDWPAFRRAFERIARRVVLGDGARDDDAVSRLLDELMRDANRAPARRSVATQARLDRFMAHVLGHVAAAEPGSLAGLFQQAPQDAVTCPVGQIPQWLSGIQDTLAVNVYRALALISAHPEQRRHLGKELAGRDTTTPEGVAALPRLTACLQEAMRLWPTTQVISRVGVVETRWNGTIVPPHTKFLIYPAFHHRDRRYYDFADRFAPDVWLPGGAAVNDWSFNHFGHGPMACPGRALSLVLGTAALAEFLGGCHVRPLGADLDPARRMPYQLNPNAVRLDLLPAIGGRRPGALSAHAV
ncbi:MAG TPA: cytochrome P450 [Streptosporangiaceae bacterium]|nr:cytochrome P450 [Streptosporangiaceae bacterium]